MGMIKNEPIPTGHLDEELDGFPEEHLLDNLPEDIIRRILSELTIDKLGSIVNVSSLFYRNANVLLADYSKTIGYTVDDHEDAPSVFIQVKRHIKDLQKFAGYLIYEMADPPADINSIISCNSPSISEMRLLYKFLHDRIVSYARAIDYNVEPYLDSIYYPPVTRVMGHVNSLLDMRERYLADQDEKDLVPEINNQSLLVQNILSLNRWRDRLVHEYCQQQPRVALIA